MTTHEEITTQDLLTSLTEWVRVTNPEIKQAILASTLLETLKRGSKDEPRKSR
jgi:hypothetical protein